MNENNKNEEIEKDLNFKETSETSKNDKDVSEKDSNLDEMFKQASSEISKYTENTEKTKVRNVVIASSVGAIAIAAIIGLGAMKMNNTSEFVNKTKEPGWVSDLENKKNEMMYTQEWDFEYPVEIPSWAKKEFSQDFFENEEEILEYTSSIEGLQTALIQIPSKHTNIHTQRGETSNKYTSNVDEMFLENGEKNEYYRHALREDYEMAFAMVSQRLLNPLFGEWVFAQKSDFSLKGNTQYEALRNMFEDTWWNKTVSKEDYSKLPILVDWTGSDWNDIELADRVSGQYGTFYGVIEESKERKIISKTSAADELGQRVIDLELPVTYYAFRKNGGTIQRKGTLHFSLKSSENSMPQDFKVLATDAKLVMDN